MFQARIARLHRPETAKAHSGDQQTLCRVVMKYHGWALKLAREKMDPTQEVIVEQQHCGGNTLTVFKERLLPGGKRIFLYDMRVELQHCETVHVHRFLHGCRIFYD